MTELEIRGIFHSELNPKRIFIKDGRWKIVNFGIKVGFAEESALADIVNTVVCKSANGMDMYSPPELINGKNYHLNKVDVYNWGMTLYQGIANIDEKTLLNETKAISKDKGYSNFMDKIKKLKIEGGDDQSINWIVDTLSKAFDIIPERRPTFAEIKLSSNSAEEYYKEELVIVKDQLTNANQKIGIF